LDVEGFQSWTVFSMVQVTLPPGLTVAEFTVLRSAITPPLPDPELPLPLLDEPPPLPHAAAATATTAATAPLRSAI